MSERVVGYKVLVYDSPDYVRDGGILYERDFMSLDSDPPGYQGGNSLRKAELHAQSMELTFPGKYVEVDCIWREDNEKIDPVN